MTDVKGIVSEHAKEVDKIIEKYLPKKYDQQRAEFALGKARYKFHIKSMNHAISEPVWEFLNRGGKRWRPVLFLLTCEALGGDSKRYADLAGLFELIHDGSIIIDDIEDNAETRRGKPVLHKMFGIDIAVNAGNALSFIPLLSVMRNQHLFEGDMEVRIYRTYAQEMINIHFGQGMDICWHKNIADADQVTEEEYLQMCAYKTGTLARLAAKVGAIVAGCPDAVVEKTGHLAEAIGIAFQIQDDILDVVAKDREKFGKSFGNDITEGKRTLMVVHTLQKANAKDRSRLLQVLKMHTKSTKTLEEAINILQKYDSINYAKQYARSIVRDAWKEAEPLLKENDAKQKLKEFANYLIERDF